MTPRTVGILLLKLWGLICLVEGFVAILGTGVLPFAPHVAAEPGFDRYVLLTAALGGIVNLALGVGLLTGAQWLVAIIDSNARTSEDVAGRYSLAELQSLLFGAVGVYFAVSALRDIGTLVYAIARQPAWDSTGRWAYLLEGRQEQLAGAAVQFVVAVVLMISRSTLASWWSRVRPMSSQSE